MGDTIDVQSAQMLRREIYARPTVARGDLTRLLEIGRSAGDSAPKEFDDLLSQVAVDLLVEQVDPPKYIQQADADWFVAQLSAGAGLGRAAEYDMLTDVLRFSVSTPANLAAFAVAEMEKRIIGDGAVRALTEADVEALRVAVFATTEGSSLHVTRDSAEALFRIAHATKDAGNAPTFDDFFAKAVGNYLMGIAFHWTPSARDEVAMEKWLDEKPEGLGAFLGRMLHVDWSRGASVNELDEARAREENAADAKERASAEAVDSTEADWLLAHITRDSALTSGEIRLLEFLKRESPSISPKLQGLIDRNAA